MPLSAPTKQASPLIVVVIDSPTRLHLPFLVNASAITLAAAVIDERRWSVVTDSVVL